MKGITTCFKDLDKYRHTCDESLDLIKRKTVPNARGSPRGDRAAPHTLAPHQLRVGDHVVCRRVAASPAARNAQHSVDLVTGGEAE